MTPEHERAVHRLKVARQQLARFQANMLGADSEADHRELRRMQVNVDRALNDVAHAERQANGGSK
jgi:hypothetical protein